MLILHLMFLLALTSLSSASYVVKSSDCSVPTEPSCGPREHYVYNTNICQKTCGNRDIYNIMGPCYPYSSCVCDNGYLRLNDDATGPCVTDNQCQKGCNGDPNASLLNCPSACPATCKNPKPGVCFSKKCPPRGCQCNPGYVLSDCGKCVKPENCPGCKGDMNATYTECTSACPRTCSNPKPQACIAMCMPEGCECNQGYVLSPAGKCILPEDCPDCNGDPNAVYVECRSNCPPTCETRRPEACIQVCRESGCQCKPGYVLSDRGKCVKPEECPALPQCDENEIPRYRKINCPPQTCDSIFTTYDCENNTLGGPGCDCIGGYLRDDDGICIPSELCFAPEPGCNGDPNASQVECRSYCPPTCQNPTPEACIDMCKPAGCQCNPGYVLSDCGKCIVPEQCPGCKGDPNATLKDCPSACPATCDNPKPTICNKMCLAKGCECNPGYVLYNGKCILPEQCPVKTGCKGDPNATFKNCTSACPATCEKPKPEICILKCNPPGCECNPGYVLSNGKCIVPDKCPGDPNATLKECPSACPATCDNPKPTICNKMCLAKGCECNPGYVLYNGKCILPEQCPVKPGCKGDPNATFRNCTSACPATCDKPSPGICIEICKPPGCVCNPGYVLSNGKCILPDKCPVKPGCNGDPNATFKNCTSACPATCDNPTPGFCILRCDPPGCQCNPGYVLSNGKCILPDKCPVKPGCNGDPNATFNNCTSACPATCDNPKPEACILRCDPPGCQCNPGYVLNNGKCILPDKCPVKPGCNGDPNATFKNCTSACPATCDNPKPEACILRCDPPGCQCNPGYVLSNGKCILPDKCPGCNGDINAIKKPCPNPCPATCDNPEPGPCNKLCVANGCECKPGYLLCNGKCVLPKDCPGGVKCPKNEQFVNCKVGCPNSYCPVDDGRGYLICDPPYPCPFGCICNTGFMRKSRKEPQCIESSTCPPVKCTRPNEVWSPSPPNCLAERCADANKPETPCDKPYRDYTPKCVCKNGYYRNDSDNCVPKNECPFQCPTHAQCRPTCAVPNPLNCPASAPATSNIDGCECQKGYILSETNGKCIKVEDCPQNQGCNNDPNAVVISCPWLCPATCDSPDASNCGKTCKPVGCQCKSGYLLSKLNGKCIQADQCPGGDPCRPNGTFVDCAFRCPNQYCPQDDSQLQVACKPGRPCPPGCSCSLNHKRLSYEDDRCIVSSDCPPVECTRPNEVWSPCPSACLAESCVNVNDQPSVCNTLVLNCEPKCICCENHYRDETGTCVPAKQCVQYNPCLSRCTPTCAEPNPPNCDTTSQCCQSGYVLSEKGGKCIRVEECPQNLGCNGDPNAVVKTCPAPCPSTCDQPNAFPCKKACKALGCECAPGYILSQLNGKCIKPEKCPGGYPCRENEMFVGCTSSCPTDYCPVDDSQAVVICDSYPCLSGCRCKPNHKRKSLSDDRCIVASDCPPVECTRPNEEWCSCPSACLRESCQDVGQQPEVCNTLLLDCQPRCVCTDNHYRNSTSICVPPNQCCR